MPEIRVSSHPLEALDGVRGVQGVRNTPAWQAEELSSRNELIPFGGLVEESMGKGVLHRFVVSEQHGVRRALGPAQYKL